jgi:hypothetical protein
VTVEGDPLLVARLGEPLRHALEGARRLYRVRVEAVGLCGQTMVVVDGIRGRLPLMFGQEEMEPAYVASVVSRAVERYAL